MKAQKFLVVLDDIDTEAFALLNRLGEHLDIACKGRYELSVGFNDAKNDLATQHGLRGAPALVNLQNGAVAYGLFKDKDFLKDLAL